MEARAAVLMACLMVIRVGVAWGEHGGAGQSSQMWQEMKALEQELHARKQALHQEFEQKKQALMQEFQERRLAIKAKYGMGQGGPWSGQNKGGEMPQKQWQGGQWGGQQPQKVSPPSGQPYTPGQIWPPK